MKIAQYGTTIVVMHAIVHGLPPRSSELKFPRIPRLEVVSVAHKEGDLKDNDSAS